MTVPAARIYVPDTNVLVAAYHHYYAPDLCLGFWDCLSHYITIDRILIVDRVNAEIVSPTALVDWVARATDNKFALTGTQSVADAYRRLIDWVQDNPQFTDAARVDFARSADGWLAAHAMANGAVVVTNEVPAPDARRRVPLPDLCDQFDIPCINTFDMLRGLGAQFVWIPAE